jgi:hypothetical protein
MIAFENPLEKRQNKAKLRRVDKTGGASAPLFFGERLSCIRIRIWGRHAGPFWCLGPPWPLLA